MSAMIIPTTILPARPVGEDDTVELNGHQVPLGVQVRVIEELARGDAAAAWCVMIASTTAIVAGYIGDASDLDEQVFMPVQPKGSSK